MHCAGRLTGEATGILSTEAKSRIGAHRRVILDLTGVTNMDSLGLGTIASLYVSAKTSGCRLELINLGPNIRRLFSMTNLLSLFENAGDNTFRLP